MLLARAVHTATALADGRVLIAGGCTTFGCESATPRTEFYLPGRARFVAGASLPRPRVGHEAVRLRDGRVLILGGWVGSDVSASTVLFDPVRTRFVAGPSMKHARGGFTATLLRDGRVLVAGGLGADGARVAAAEVFDPTTGRFAAAGSLATPRDAHAAVLIRDGRVALFGGSSASGYVEKTIELWDPASTSFTPGGEMTVVRHKHAAVALRDGRVLVVGGSDARDFRGRYRSAELYDPVARTSRATSPMREPRFKIANTLVRLPIGHVLVPGGGTTVERFDPATGKFRVTGTIGTPRAFASATLLRNGKMLVAGGYDSNIQPAREARLVSAH